MTEIYDAMIEHIGNIVHIEKRPFCYKDFISFTVNDKNYTMTHGTIRNYFFKLKKDEEIELVYNSGIAYYTLKGISVGKSITPNHMGIAYSHPFYRFIQDLPLGKKSIHDIHLRFSLPDLWLTFSSNTSFNVNQYSKDIKIASWKFDGGLVDSKVIIHRTDTVSVIIGCSFRPFPLDIPGIIHLSNILTSIEERIDRLIDDNLSKKDLFIKDNPRPNLIVPNHNEWIITMWHFGFDSLIEFSGEKFCIKWETAENMLIQIYSKSFKDNKSKIRLERHECPNKTFIEAIEQKLST
jgi:hypothetical protein